MKVSKFVSIGLAGLLVLAPAAAQAPDCTGISDASNYDGANISDFNGRLATVLVASGLTSPNFVTSPPGDVDRLFIVEQDGKIKIHKNGAVLATPFLDITDITLSPLDGGHNEEGLLGLAFHPEYDTNGWFFVYHTNDDGSQNVVARYTVSANPDVANSGSREEVIAVDHPTWGDQDGGMLAFGPNDGYLYIGSGDGGGDCDPNTTAQDLNSNLGKILRVNVDSLPYSTAGNPYDGGTPGNDEIWSYGMRNAWRFSFDRITGKMMIADVGEGTWEEISCQTADSDGGHNYGWSNYEGPTCPAPSTGCADNGCTISDYVAPIRYYNHVTAGFSCAVQGGYIYRGCRMTDLHGTYFYGDYCSSFVKTFRVNEACETVPAGPDVDSDNDRTADLGAGDAGAALLTSFGEDARGALYLVYRTGQVFKILPTLSVMETSGLNAPPLHAAVNGDWVWEDLQVTSGHTIASYKVYRSTNRAGLFSCVHSSTDNVWNGGDPATPTSGNAYYYLVTAIGSTGEQTRPGTQSDGSARLVALGSTCP